MKLTGAQILMKVLKEEGVDTIFGYPGGAVLDIYDELVRTDIRHILVRHEQGAVHAADGYARASGQGRGLPGHLRARRDQHRDRASPRPTWTPFPSWSSPARCRPI